MIYLCKCGKFKSGQPPHSSATKRWICPRCAQRHLRVRPKVHIPIRDFPRLRAA